MKSSTALYVPGAGIILTGCASGLSNETIFATDDGYGYYCGPDYYGLYDPHNDLFFDDYGYYGLGLYGGITGMDIAAMDFMGALWRLRRSRFVSGRFSWWWRNS